MVFVNKIKMTPRELAMVEYAIALEHKNAANIDYLSMMVDIDLESDNEVMGVGDEAALDEATEEADVPAEENPEDVSAEPDEAPDEAEDAEETDEEVEG